MNDEARCPEQWAKHEVVGLTRSEGRNGEPTEVGVGRVDVVW